MSTDSQKDAEQGQTKSTTQGLEVLRGDRVSFRLPLQEMYIVPQRCSSCDEPLEEGADTYVLRLEQEGKKEGAVETALDMPLCEHCRRRRSSDRVGAFIGIIIGALAIVALYPALRGIHPLLALLAAFILFFGVAVGFSIIWINICDLTMGRPRFSSVLFHQSRGSRQVTFVFNNRAYGERFYHANVEGGEETAGAASPPDRE